MKYRVYVAASSQEMDRAKTVIAALKSQGVHVTSKWVEHIEKLGMANEGLTNIQASEAALMNIESILRSDCLLLLMPEKGYSHGAMWEFGLAYGIRTTTVVAGKYDRSVFCSQADVFDVDDTEAVRWICDKFAAEN